MTSFDAGGHVAEQPRLDDAKLGLSDRASAAIGVIARAAAILLWSVAILQRQRHWLGWLGSMAMLPSVALMLGLLRLDVHGAMLARLGESIWNVALAWRLLRRKF